ncbi:MAG: hypothetical protein IGR93_13165 [Hydrococcus sp. C42_A2020_068]|uniref:hypothetical protein n=1 Tax=Pleurocapsa sp. PCC 7327 TaxID=118163 RepID=UPI00029FDF2C|nr:hypothetical protein [Pleurocapsa sp. PCC 7327]AFY79446.1 hypothetical protein Ple7327_4335 [Pleurocapsa sp. PCC 7327]MBF2021021.1 hypothetical protein [Hydrococcus sp. C42_A2020_068]
MNILNRAIAVTSYLFAFTWGTFIFLSFIGWGGAINRFLFPRNQVDWGQRAAWGMAFSVCVGGVLNLTWTISRTTILIYLGAGFLNCLVDFYQNRRSLRNFFNRVRNCFQDKLFILGVFIVFLLILVECTGWVRTHIFERSDDYQGYLVFPQKMLQIGSIGADPFNERRMVALGGQSFLQTLVLSMLETQNLNLIDPGIALVISLGILIGYLRKKHISKYLSIFLLIVFLILPYPKPNISSTVTPVALFLSFFVLLDCDDLKSNIFFSKALIIAIIAAAICSLKASLIPTCSLLFFSSYFFYILGSGRQCKTAIYEFIISFILVFVFLLPWMISMYQSSGTLLYPLLGKGYHGSVYGTYLSPSSELTFSSSIQIIIRLIFWIYFFVFIVLGLLCFLFLPQFVNKRGLIPSLIISVGLGTIVVTLSAGGSSSSFYRYPFPFLYTAIFILLINACANPEDTNKNKVSASSFLLIAMLMLGLLIGGSDAISHVNWQRYANLLIGNIRVGLSNRPLVSAQEIEQYLKMQQSIPESTTILVRLEKPFLLNFKRNQIFVVDWPGGASPPPGMPFFQGSEVLADYLVSKSIKYVVYSYAKEAGFPRQQAIESLKPNVHVWFRTIAHHTLDFQDNLIKLSKTRKKIYDDGDIFILDLLNY